MQVTIQFFSPYNAVQVLYNALYSLLDALKKVLLLLGNMVSHLEHSMYSKICSAYGIMCMENVSGIKTLIE